MLSFDMNTLPPRERYRLLTGLVVPRPIALVTTLSPEGVVNAAPFSFFNCFGADPPLVMLGLSDRRPGQVKDTLANVRHGGEFVVNVVDVTLAQRMNVCAGEFPHGASELTAAGLISAPSSVVAPPGIAESLGRLECRCVSVTEIGANRLILGQVVMIHMDESMAAPQSAQDRAPTVHWPSGREPLGRLSGDGYVDCKTQFEMKRP